MGDVVKREINKDGVLTVTLNRPESLNSLNYELVMSVISAFDEASSVSYTHLTLPTTPYV